MKNIDLFREELRGKCRGNWREHREVENVPRKESEREKKKGTSVQRNESPALNEKWQKASARRWRITKRREHRSFAKSQIVNDVFKAVLGPIPRY